MEETKELKRLLEQHFIIKKWTISHIPLAARGFGQFTTGNVEAGFMYQMTTRPIVTEHTPHLQSFLDALSATKHTIG